MAQDAQRNTHGCPTHVAAKVKSQQGTEPGKDYVRDLHIYFNWMISGRGVLLYVEKDRPQVSTFRRFRTSHKIHPVSGTVVPRIIGLS